MRRLVSRRVNPGKPDAVGGAAHPSYFHPATETGPTVLDAVAVDDVAVVVPLVNGADVVVCAEAMATKPAITMDVKSILKVKRVTWIVKTGKFRKVTKD
jgi:predicted nicotinamide N-methyase